jgi:hypothetical protein
MPTLPQPSVADIARFRINSIASCCRMMIKDCPPTSGHLALEFSRDKNNCSVPLSVVVHWTSLDEAI